MHANLRSLLVIPALLLGACDSHYHEHVGPLPPSPRLCSILVEVYDPGTNFVWENVAVRVVEAEQEWSQCVCQSPFEDWYFTDHTGQVLLDEYVLAMAQVGFREDGAGRAILGPHGYEDQATVLLEIDAIGFTPVFVEVELSWGVPDVFIAVPFN